MQYLRLGRPHLPGRIVGARPAVMRAYELAKNIKVRPTVSEESKSILFGQTAATAAR